LIKLVLFRLKSGAYRIGAGGCKAGTHSNLFSGAVAIPLVIGAVLYVTGNSLVYAFMAAILVIHFDRSPFR
jgi:hypothetical protein